MDHKIADKEEKKKTIKSPLQVAIILSWSMHTYYEDGLSVLAVMQILWSWEFIFGESS